MGQAEYDLTNCREYQFPSDAQGDRPFHFHHSSEPLSSGSSSQELFSSQEDESQSWNDLGQDSSDAALLLSDVSKVPSISSSPVSEEVCVFPDSRTQAFKSHEASFKKGGLIKKTISINIKNILYHIVCYSRYLSMPCGISQSKDFTALIPKNISNAIGIRRSDELGLELMEKCAMSVLCSRFESGSKKKAKSDRKAIE